MRLIVTGGHITPALALLPTLRKKHEILFIIRKTAYEGDSRLSFEAKTVQALDVPYNIINTGRLQRHFSWHTIPSLLRLPLGFVQSLSILRAFRPNVVLSFGGYVALPVCFAAFILGIPIVTHEQTASNEGLANRIIALFAKKICVSFRNSASFFPRKKVIYTGNPIRQELLKSPKMPPSWIREIIKKDKAPVIYITGGSGGSHTINTNVLIILEDLLKKYIVIHQTGTIALFNDYEEVLKEERELPLYLQKRYLRRNHVTGEELAWIYPNISLLVGRSGANTVYEILALTVPSLLLPLNEEQMANAKLAQEFGLAKIIRDEKLTAHTLFSTIESMVENKEKFAKKDIGIIHDADQKIMQVLEEVAKS